MVSHSLLAPDLHAAVNMANAVGVATVPTFPFESNPNPVIRTKQSFTAGGVNATEQLPVNGIKGPSPMLLIDDCDPVMAFDYSHDVCLGHVKKQLNLWFAPKFQGEAFSFRQEVGNFDRLMRRIKAPSFVSRTPKPFKKIGHWKG